MALDEALPVMACHQVRRLPVVEHEGRLVGIFAQADAAQALSPERVGEVAEAISEPQQAPDANVRKLRSFPTGPLLTRPCRSSRLPLAPSTERK